MKTIHARNVMFAQALLAQAMNEFGFIDDPVAVTLTNPLEDQPGCAIETAAIDLACAVAGMVLPTYLQPLSPVSGCPMFYINRARFNEKPLEADSALSFKSLCAKAPLTLVVSVRDDARLEITATMRRTCSVFADLHEISVYLAALMRYLTAAYQLAPGSVTILWPYVSAPCRHVDVVKAWKGHDMYQTGTYTPYMFESKEDADVFVAEARDLQYGSPMGTESYRVKKMHAPIYQTKLALEAEDIPFSSRQVNALIALDDCRDEAWKQACRSQVAVMTDPNA